MTIHQAFRKTLREIRVSRRLSQERLAELADLDRTYISMLERGVRRPSIETFYKVSKGLKIRASEFMARVEAKLR